MAELFGNMLVAQSGGPTAVINASMCGVIKEAGCHECIEELYGGLNGILGILNEDLIDIGEEKARAIIAEASSAMEEQLQSEIDRLTSLREVNDHVRPEEIDLAREQLAQLTDVISRSRVRLDTLRLIWKGSPEAITGA